MEKLFPNGKKPTVVFAGGGHAQLYSLRRTRELVKDGLDVVLVNPSRFLYYSGMAPGLLSRTYRPEDARIDVRHLVEKGGGRFVEDRVKGIRSKTREVVLEGGASIRYDAMSVCLGSGVPGESPGVTRDYLVPVKPVENIESLRRKLRSLEENESDQKRKVLVVGGGPAGCEVACNARRVFEEHGINGRIVIAEAGDALLESAPGRARRKIEEFLRSRGVEVLLGSKVVGIEEGVAHTGDGRKIGFDVAVLAVGIKPPEIFRESGLATGDDGGLWVNRYLRSISDPRIFGGGDSVAFRGEALRRLGVFAIRQGPVLFHNLRAVLKGEPLKEFKPQKSYLYVLNLGDGTGLAIYGPLVWRGAAAWKLKSYIDRKFVKEYQYPEDELGEAGTYSEQLPAKDAASLEVDSGSPAGTNGESAAPGSRSSETRRPSVL